jgi:hypothetical protein
MKVLRVLLVAAGLALAAALASAAPAVASDCGNRIHSIQDINASGNINDCLQTGAAYSATIGAVVAGVGVVIAVIGLPGGRGPVTPTAPAQPQPPQPQSPQAPPEEQKPDDTDRSHPPDPCADRVTRVQVAGASSRILFSGVQTLRDQVVYFNREWENARQAGFWSAAYDLASMAGPILATPVAKAVAKVTGKVIVEVALKDTIRARVIEAALKSLEGTLGKDVLNSLAEQGIDWQDPAAVAKLASSTKEAITRAQLEKTVKGWTLRSKDLGFDPAYESVKHLVEEAVAAPIAELIPQTVSLLSIGYGTFESHERMEAIHAILNQVEDHLTRLEGRWEDAVNELDLATASLAHCRQLQVERVEPS